MLPLHNEHVSRFGCAPSTQPAFHNKKPLQENKKKVPQCRNPETWNKQKRAKPLATARTHTSTTQDVTQAWIQPSTCTILPSATTKKRITILHASTLQCNTLRSTLRLVWGERKRAKSDALNWLNPRVQSFDNENDGGSFQGNCDFKKEQIKLTRVADCFIPLHHRDLRHHPVCAYLRRTEDLFLFFVVWERETCRWFSANT